MSIEQDLLKKKEKIDEAKEEKNRLEGQMQSNLKRLKDEFGFSTLAAARKGLEKLRTSLKESENKLKMKLEKLEEDFEW